MVLDRILPSGTTTEQEIVHAKFVLGADGETRNISSTPVELIVPPAQVHIRGFGKPWASRWMGNKQVDLGANSNMRYSNVTFVSDYIWGVIDFIPDTDFPDIRNRAAIHSSNGSCMIIPREGDKVRFYLQMADKDVMDPETGRIDKHKVTAENLINVCTHLIASEDC